MSFLKTNISSNREIFLKVYESKNELFVQVYK